MIKQQQNPRDLRTDSSRDHWGPTCTDPEWRTGGPDPPPEKSQKYRIF